MPQRLLTKAEFARLCGRSKAAITKAIRGSLQEALVGDRLDVDHAAARLYLAACGKKVPPAQRPTRSAKRVSSSPSAPTDSTESDDSGSADPTERRPKGSLPPPRLNRDRGLEQLAELPRYRDLTFRELTERWGTFRVFSDLLDALKTIEDIRKTHLHNEETEGSLISRDLVRTSIFGGIESAFKRLLTDAPRTIAGRVLAMGKSGASVEEAERVVREIIGGHLKVVKATAVRVLRGGPTSEESGASAA